MRPVLEYGAVWWDSCREGRASVLNPLQKRAAKFANDINESGWETLAQGRFIAQACAIFKAYTGGRAWKAIGDRLLKPCHLSREDRIREIRIRKHRRDVSNYSFVNRTIKRWIQLSAGLLASFSRKLTR